MYIFKIKETKDAAVFFCAEALRFARNVNKGQQSDWFNLEYAAFLYFAALKEEFGQTEWEKYLPIENWRN